MKDFSNAIDINNNIAKYFYARGNSYTYIENYQKALQDYNKAIALDPEYGIAYYGRGVAKKYLEDHAAALSDLNTYFDMNGNSDGLAKEVQRLINEIEFDMSNKN